MRTPVFFAFIAKSTSKSTQICEKNFSHFLDHPPEEKSFSGHAIIKISQTQEFSVFISQMMLNGPKNGLTYTQNDREKWSNTFTMIVSAILHVLVTEKVQQASTITLGAQVLPRIGLSRTSYGGISLQSLYSFQLAPQISQNWQRLPPYTTCSMRPEGGPLGQAGKPRPKGCGHLPLPRGQATLQFWAVGGAMLSLTPKKHISGWFGTNTWSVVGVGAPLCREKKNGENGKTKFPTLLDRIFARPISPNWYAHPRFFCCHCKVHIKKYPKMRKTIFAFFGPPSPKKKNFPGHAIIKISQTQEFSVFIS